MRAAQAVGIVVGVGLLAAPAAVGYAGSGPGDLHRVVGPLVSSLALIARWEATRAVRWPNLVLAAGLVMAPLVVEHPPAAAAVGVVSGLILAVATPFAGAASHALGGGWAGLLSQAQARKGT